MTRGSDLQRTVLEPLENSTQALRTRDKISSLSVGSSEIVDADNDGSNVRRDRYTREVRDCRYEGMLGVCIKIGRAGRPM